MSVSGGQVKETAYAEAAYSLFERKQWRGLAEAHHRSPDQIIAERPSGRNVSSAAEQSPPMHPNPASHSLPRRGAGRVHVNCDPGRDKK